VIDALKRIVPSGVKAELKRRLFAVNDMTARLRNLRRAGFICSGAIDAGAFDGEWSCAFWKTFSDVPVCMIEPLPAKAAPLADLARNHRAYFVAAALGNRRGTAHFRIAETNSQIVEDSEKGSIVVEVTTIDDVLAKMPSFRPNLLKLDLQGYELQALEGCSHLELFEVIVLEVSILRIGDVPIFSEVDAFLNDRTFRLYDVIPQYYRPLDGALWQCDAFYVRNDSKLIASRAWI